MMIEVREINLYVNVFFFILFNCLYLIKRILKTKSYNLKIVFDNLVVFH